MEIKSFLYPTENTSKIIEPLTVTEQAKNDAEYQYHVSQ